MRQGRDIRRRSHSDDDILEDEERAIAAVTDGRAAAEARNRADEDELVGAFVGSAKKRR